MPPWLAIILLGLLVVVLVGFCVLTFGQLARKHDTVKNKPAGSGGGRRGRKSTASSASKSGGRGSYKKRNRTSR